MKIVKFTKTAFQKYYKKTSDKKCQSFFFKENKIINFSFNKNKIIQNGRVSDNEEETQ